MLKFLGFGKTKHVLYMDSSAALAMSNRIGVGNVHHIDSRLLWLQQFCLEDLIDTRKIDGKQNPADLWTKVHSKESFDYLCDLLNLREISEERIEATTLKKAVTREKPDMQKVAAAMTLLCQFCSGDCSGVVAVRESICLAKVIPEKVDTMLVMNVTAATFVVGISVGIWLIYKFAGLGQARNQQQTANKQCQSLTTYRADLRPARFQPLRDDYHGCWEV